MCAEIVKKNCSRACFWTVSVNVTIVAEQMHECINVKNPSKCVGGICVFMCQFFSQSIVSALLNFTLPCIIFLVFFSGDTSREYWTRSLLKFFSQSIVSAPA
jgi:hypothetical protein